MNNIKDNLLTPDEFIAFKQGPNITLHVRPSGSDTLSRALRIVLLFGAMALLVPWVEGQLISKLFNVQWWAVNVQLPPGPFIYAIIMNCVLCTFVGITIGFPFAVCREIMRETTSPQLVTKLEKLLNERYKNGVKQYGNEITRESAKKVSANVQESAYKDAKYLLGLSFHEDHMARIIFTVLANFTVIIGLYYVQDTIIAELSSKTLVILIFCQITALALAVDSAYASYGYLLAQLSPAPLKKTRTRIHGMVYALAVIGIVATSILKQVVPNEAYITYATPAAAAKIAHKKLLIACNGKTWGEGLVEAEFCLQTVEELAERFETVTETQTQYTWVTSENILRTTDFTVVQQITILLDKERMSYLVELPK